MGHLRLHRRQMFLHLLQPVAQFVDVEVGYLGYVLVPNLEGE